MDQAARPASILVVLLLAACWQDAPLRPAAPADAAEVDVSAGAKLNASPEEVAGLLGALEDAITREVPGLRFDAGAQNVETSLRELAGAVSSSLRLQTLRALHGAQDALGAYGAGTPDLAADLAAMDAIRLVLDHAESLAVEGAPRATH
jgi:hypothetical protein